jgi:GTP-binding protein EngB required for normal cell division
MTRRPPLALPERLDAADRVLDLAEGRVSRAGQDALRAARTKADARLARGDDLVVAALVGGTGGGKSSLFNALTGAPLSPVGVLRPTTEQPRAALSGVAEGGGRLLDWLEVRQRHLDPPGPAAGSRGPGRGRGPTPAVPAGWPEGLVLLDVPDHDSVATGHREVVDRLVARVDVLVWVVDPLKYAMRSLHAGYLGRLASHAEVVLVVLNRADELSEDDLAACRDDLRRLLDAEGLGRARLLTSSARTGHGVDALARTLGEEAEQRRAAAERLVADLRAAAGDVLDEVGPEPEGPLQPDGVVEALAGAAGVGGVAASAAAESRAAAMDGTRPVVSMAGAALLRRGPALLRQPSGGRVVGATLDAQPLEHRLAGGLEDVGDLLADELVALEQRVAQRLDEVAVRLDERAHARLGLGEEPIDLWSGHRVGEDPADEVRVVERGVLRRGERHERAGHPAGADDLAGDLRRVGEIAAGTGAGLVEELLLGAHAAHGDLDEVEHLLAAALVDLVEVAVGEQPERAGALHDRQDLEAPGAAR